MAAKISESCAAVLTGGARWFRAAQKAAHCIFASLHGAARCTERCRKRVEERSRERVPVRTFGPSTIMGGAADAVAAPSRTPGLVHAGLRHNSLHTISAVGDSQTYGSCSSKRGLYSWPSRLQHSYLNDDPTVRVLNFGVSGRTMRKDGDKPYWQEASFQRALKSSPDAVTIGLGTNDAKFYNWNREDFEEDYAAMVTTFQALDPTPEIWMIVPPPLYGEGYDMNATIINEIFPTLIPQLADRLNATGVIDIFSALGGRELKAPELLCNYQSAAAASRRETRPTPPRAAARPWTPAGRSVSELYATQAATSATRTTRATTATRASCSTSSFTGPVWAFSMATARVGSPYGSRRRRSSGGVHTGRGGAAAPADRRLVAPPGDELGPGNVEPPDIFCVNADQVKQVKEAFISIGPGGAAVLGVAFFAALCCCCARMCRRARDPGYGRLSRDDEHVEMV